MPDTSAVHEFARYLRAHWRLIVSAVLVAPALALGVSLLLPPRYTATAKVMIEPPAGTDPRAATAVSPVYLESLRTYEHFATSDGLFLRALERFKLRRADPGKPVEAWKKSVLKVELPRNTRMLEIRATLPDPKTAHELARFLAEEAVRLNREVNRDADRQVAENIERQVAEATASVDKAEAARDALVRGGGVAGLTRDIEAAEWLKSDIERERIAADLLAVENTAPESPARARAEHLRNRSVALQKEIEAKRKLLADRMSRLDAAEKQFEAARSALAALETQWRQTLATAGQRGERLAVIDPGIVPERPSSPNIPLNVVAALLMGLVASVACLTLAFGLRTPAAKAVEDAVRIARSSR